MAHYIITGCYTSAGIKGMIAHPSDREAAARAIIEAGGGKLKSFLVTTGDTDFSMIVEAEESERMLASLMVVSASGAVSNLKTVRAYTSAEFTQAQKMSAALMAAYMAPT